MNHYIIARSNWSSDVYSDNSPSRFTNSLLRPVDVSVGNRKIALQSIVLPNKFGNVPTKILSTNNHLMLYNINFVGELDTLLLSATIRQDNFENNAALQKYLKSIVMENKFKHRILMGFDDDDNHFRILVKNSTLLVMKELADWLHISSEINIEKNGCTYYVFQSNSAVIYKIYTSAVRFQLEPIIPKLLKIQLNEMKPSYTGKGYHKYIAILTGEQVKTYPSFITFPKRNYFELDAPTLSTLGISLFDQDDQPIILKGGPPSTLQFKLKNMERGENYFPVNLSSTDSDPFFPNNSNNSFKIVRKFPLAENRSYQVALSSFFCPSQMDVAKLLHKDLFYILFANSSEEDWYTITFDDIAFPNISVIEIVAKINETIDHLFNKLWITNKSITAQYNHYNELEIIFNSNAFVKPSPLFAYLFDVTDSIAKEDVERGAGTTLNLGNFTLERCLPELIEVHCSIVNPILAASSYVKILKIIPFDAKIDQEERIIKYESPNHDFLAISGGGDNQIIHFELKDSMGNLIPFKDNIKPVYVNLLFREI